MDLLLLYDFVPSSIGYLENTDSLSYADLSNVDIFYDIKLFKSHFEKYTATDLKRKVHFGGCCQAHDDKYKFSRISVFT